jgi:hypothetical protein
MKIHPLPKAVDIFGVLPDDDVAQAVPPLGRAWRLDDRLANVRLAAHLADAHQPIVGANSDNEDILRAIGNFLNVGNSQVQGFDVRDFHDALW